VSDSSSELQCLGSPYVLLVRTTTVHLWCNVQTLCWKSVEKLHWNYL